MANKTPSNKPFYLVSRKAGPKNSVSETDICQFVQIVTENLRLNPAWKPFANNAKTWEPRRVTNRGFTGTDAVDEAEAVSGMLNYIASYAPPHLLREITERCTSLPAVWSLLRKWAGIQPTGLKILEYSRLQQAWDPNGDMNASEFFYAMLDTMQDVLLLKDGKVKYEDKALNADEDMTPTLRSSVVKDWIIALGGQALFEHVCRTYTKDLETSTLSDIQD